MCVLGTNTVFFLSLIIIISHNPPLLFNIKTEPTSLSTCYFFYTVLCKGFTSVLERVDFGYEGIFNFNDRLVTSWTLKRCHYKVLHVLFFSARPTYGAPYFVAATGQCQLGETWDSYLMVLWMFANVFQFFILLYLPLIKSGSALDPVQCLPWPKYCELIVYRFIWFVARVCLNSLQLLSDVVGCCQ